MPKSLLIVLALLIYGGALAQSDTKVEHQYRDALRMFEEGNIDSTLYLVKGLIASGKHFRSAEKSVRADIFWLGMQASLLLKQNEEAYAYMKQLLALRPYYQVSERDLEDVAKMLGMVSIQPRLSATVEFGQLQSWANVMDAYYVFVQADGTPLHKQYPNPLKPTSQISVGARYAFHKNFALHVGISQIGRKFDYGYSLQQATATQVFDENDADSDGDFDELLQTENYSFRHQYSHNTHLTSLEVPVSVRGQVIVGKRMTIFGEAGVFAGYVTDASKRITFNETDNFSIVLASDSRVLFSSTEAKTDVFDTNVLAMMMRGHWGATAGAGFSFRVKQRIRLNAGVRYRHIANNIVRESARYTYEDLTYGFYDLYDNMALRSLGAYISWEIPISFKAFEK